MPAIFGETDVEPRVALIPWEAGQAGKDVCLAFEK